MDALIKIFSEHGLAGLVIGALFYALYLVINDHKAERAEWLIAFRELKTTIELITQKL